MVCRVIVTNPEGVKRIDDNIQCDRYNLRMTSVQKVKGKLVKGLLPCNLALTDGVSDQFHEDMWDAYVTPTGGAEFPLFEAAWQAGMIYPELGHVSVETGNSTRSHAAFKFNVLRRRRGLNNLPDAHPYKAKQCVFGGKWMTVKRARRQVYVKLYDMIVRRHTVFKAIRGVLDKGGDGVVCLVSDCGPPEPAFVDADYLQKMIFRDRPSFSFAAVLAGSLLGIDVAAYTARAGLQRNA
jgi:hypothetical protein